MTRPDPADHGFVSRFDLLRDYLLRNEAPAFVEELDALAAEVVALRAELAEARASQFPEIDESLLPDGVSAASWDPVTLTARAEAHCRHAWDHNMEVKAWVVLTLLRERAAREAAEERASVAERERDECREWTQRVSLTSTEAATAAEVAEARLAESETRLREAQTREKQLREAIASALTSLGTGPARDGYAYSVLDAALGSAAAADKKPRCSRCDSEISDDGLRCACSDHAAADTREDTDG